MSSLPAPEPWRAVLEADEELASLGSGGGLPYRLGLLPPQVGFDAGEVLADSSSVEHALSPDTDQLREELLDALRESNAFSEVATRGDFNATFAEGVQAAWEARDDLVLELTVTRNVGHYFGHARHVGYVVLFFTYVWPAYYLTNDIYGWEYEVEARLRSVQGGAAPLFEGTFRVEPREVKRELTSFDREFVGLFDLSSLWSVEESLEPSNWRAIERAVAPHARREVLAELLREVERQVARPLRAASEEARQRLRKRFALSVGISSYADPRIGACPDAARDASRWADFLAGEGGGGLEMGREQRLLTDEAASREAVLAELRDLSERAGPDDELILFFAGYGSSVASVDSSGKALQLPTLVTHASDPQQLGQTGVTFADLADVLDEARVGRVLLLVDAGFGSESGARSIAPVQSTSASGGAPALAASLGAGPGRAALLASGAHDALRLAELRAGLFTEIVLRGLSPLEGLAPADGNQDHRVELPELVEFVTHEVSSRAGLEGGDQTPLLLGEVPIAWPR